MRPSQSADISPADTRSLLSTLAHHDAEIVNLSARMTGVEGGLNRLGEQVTSGFAGLTSKIDKMDAVPHMDPHKAVGTVVALAVLFGMVVSGIVWISTAIAGVPLATLQATDTHFDRWAGRAESRIERLETDTSTLKEKFGWTGREARP